MGINELSPATRCDGGMGFQRASLANENYSHYTPISRGSTSTAATGRSRVLFSATMSTRRVARKPATAGRTRRTRPARLPRFQPTHTGVVLPEWIDYNGHMNLSYYVLLFDHATDRFLDRIGLTATYRARHDASTFSAEIHVNYLRELKVGDPVRITTQLLDHDGKRMHYFHRMFHAREGWLAATNELMSLYVDMKARRVAQMPAPIRRRLAVLAAAHRRLPRPEQAGSVIGIRRTGGKRRRTST